MITAIMMTLSKKWIPVTFIELLSLGKEKRKFRGTVEERIYSGILKLEKLRRENKAFSNKADTWVMDTKNSHVLAFGRYFEGVKLLCFYNFSVNTEVAYVSEVEDYVNMLTGKKMKAKDLVIPSHDFIWLKTSF